MKNLYIDFDGVILDTITPVYNLAKRLNLDVKTQTKEVGLLYAKIDWETLIDESPALSDSINNIKKLKDSKKLVDDFSGNLKEWKESGGISVKFVRDKENGKYPEITSLEELLDMKF